MSFFEILAECSIALAGFGSVHAALRGSVGPRGAFRAWTVVAQGALAFVLSVLPLVLAFASVPSEHLWRSVSIVGAVGCAAAAYSFIAFDLRMARLGHPPQAPLTIRTAQLSVISAALAMLLDLIGWPWPPGPLLYAVALVLVLLTGLLALLHSFLVPVQLALRDEAEPPDGPPSA